jgi:hypothetical protein
MIEIEREGDSMGSHRSPSLCRIRRYRRSHLGQINGLDRQHARLSRTHPTLPLRKGYRYRCFAASLIAVANAAAPPNITVKTACRFRQSAPIPEIQDAALMNRSFPHRPDQADHSLQVDKSGSIWYK